MIRRLLALNEIASIDINSDDRLKIHQEILGQKQMLQEVFRECHDLLIDMERRYFGDTTGLRIELGAGVAPIRNSDPDILVTDVVPAAHLDRVLDAQAMDLPDNVVRTLFGQNCFHHFPEPSRFFAEAVRVLKPGGGVILIEPYYGLCASFLFKRLFSSEGFDKEMPGWTVPMNGPMNGANQALSYLVFKRDRAEFERQFPSLELVHTEPLGNYLRYLLSGGLNFRQLIPDAAIPAIRLLERLAYPLNRWLALHYVLVLRRR